MARYDNPNRDAAAACDWRRELAAAFRNGASLLQHLDLDADEIGWSENAARRFHCLVPRPFADRMRPRDPADPLLLQVLPTHQELMLTTGYSTDPLGEADCQVTPGLLRKYSGRVLLTLTGACGIHCRYCFRRYYPYAEFNPAIDAWRASLSYLRSHSDCTEVIFSGGDPLLLSDNVLQSLIRELDAIPHVERLRIHTRMPVAIPSRVTGSLLSAIGEFHRPLTIVVHVNHANELDDNVAVAVAKLRTAGAMLLNQSVLLRRVNDRSEDLAQLSTRLYAIGILPYYVHQLDKVQGAAHFDVPEVTASRLQAELRRLLPGYLVPRFVRERYGAVSKTPIKESAATTDIEI